MSLLDNLPHTVDHYRKRYERDEYIGNTSTPVSIATGVQAWVQNASMSEVDEFQKLDQRVTHKVFYSADPGIRPGDRIVVTAGTSFCGKTFDFRAMTDRSAGMGILFGVMVEEERNVPAGFG